MNHNTLMEKVTRRIFQGLLCFLPALVWFVPAMPQALACESVATAQQPTLILADNPVDRGLARLGIEGTADKAEGTVEEAKGKVQRSVGKVTGQTEGAIEEAKGKSKQAIGEAKQNVSEAGDDAKDTSKNIIEKVKDFFD